MKTIQASAAALLMAGSLSIDAQRLEISPEESEVIWTGKKIGKSHTGAIEIKKGYIEIEDDRIRGGKVIMDMTTITNHDLKDPGWNQKLVGHLKSADFFGVENHPHATFEVTGASDFDNGKATVIGILTIKGISEEISFELLQEGNIYATTVQIDRSKFDVRYGSGSFFDNLGDNAIDNLFTLDISLAI